MLPTRGRPGAVLLMTTERELTPSDLMNLSLSDQQAPTVYDAAPKLQRLRESHHRAARLLARGLSVRDVAFEVGRTPQRISDLLHDPTFQELVSSYQAANEQVETAATQRIQTKLVDVAELATDEILDRLEDDAKRASIPVGELRQIAAMGLDRTLAPPKTAQPIVSTPTHITFNMGTKDIRPKPIDHEDLIFQSSIEVDSE